MSITGVCFERDSEQGILRITCADTPQLILRQYGEGYHLELIAQCVQYCITAGISPEVLRATYNLTKGIEP